MLIGPALYVLSALIVQARQLAHTRMPTPRPLRIVRQMVVGGDAISVSWFREAKSPRARFAWRRAAERDWTGPADALVLGAAFTSVMAPLLVALDAPAAVRLPFVLAFLCLAPGIAWLTAVRGRAEPGLVIGISMGVAGITAQSMLWFGIWRPREFLYAVATRLSAPPDSAPRDNGSADLRRRACARQTSQPAHTRPPAPARCGADVGPGDPYRRHLAGDAAWATSLAGADLARMNGLGLLAAMPPTYFLAFGLLLAGFVGAVTSRKPNARLLGAYVLALVVVIHGTTAVLYNEPRYAWTYPHLGVIDLIATDHSSRQIDIYNNWPAFFALNAWFSKTSGLAAISYAGWAQLFFNFFNVLVIRFAFRGLTGG